jgi:hypothetical protein
MARLCTMVTSLAALLTISPAFSQDKFDPTARAVQHISSLKVGKLDWPMWGGSPARNNTPAGENIPDSWDLDSGENLLWAAALGSQTYGNPVIANGKVFVGTNNSYGYVKRYPKNVDLGCLVCFDEQTGKFLWQCSSPKLPTGRVHDWPQQGICSTVYCEDSRLWYVTSRGEVLCLDVEGFHDGENDGPFKGEPNNNKDEADIIWRLDMMGTLGVSQHNMCSCSVTAAGKYLFVDTGNGVDEGHLNIPAPKAASHLCIEKDTGKVLWTDNSPGVNVLHGQWSSPVYFEAGGQAQIVFGSGDGWMYSFDPAGDGKGQPKLLWKFDGNPKESLYLLGGRATRNHFIGTPVFYDGHVYCAVGEDPEHGEGIGHLYCLDPTKRGDISLELAIGPDGKEMPHRRLQAVDTKKGEKAVPNPNAAVVWHYDSQDTDGDGKIEFEETMHRTIGSVAIKDDLLFVADFSGLIHCLDAKKLSSTGKPKVYWTHDMFAASWGSPLIVDGKVYVGDEDGDITICELSAKKNILGEPNMLNSIYSTPVVANNTLFISNKSTLFAIKKGAKLEGGFKPTTRTESGDSE